MPELRKDPIVGRWVIIATERARRPGNFVSNIDKHVNSASKDCPYCQPAQNIIHKTSLNSSNSHQWDVCVVPFEGSFLTMQQPYRRETKGLYDVANGFGAHEVVIDTPEHVSNMADLSQEQIELILKTYILRASELEKNRNFQYSLIYKNYGSTAGARSIGHSRSHIIATPVNPLHVKEKLRGAKEYYQSKKGCIYCDLMHQEYADKKRIVFETDHFLAIHPFAARFLFETWILPKIHHCNFAEGAKGVEADLAYMLKIILKKLKVGLDDPSYNFMIHTAPFYRAHIGKNRWDTIEEDYHWHIEITPRISLMAGFEKGTDFYINVVPPENTAEYLREVEI